MTYRRQRARRVLAGWLLSATWRGQVVVICAVVVVCYRAMKCLPEPNGCWYFSVFVGCLGYCCGAAVSALQAAPAAAIARASGIVQADVRDFGAVGNGATDDAAAVESALAALVQQGAGTLFFPPGQYALSRALLVRGYGIILRGAGMHPPSACGFGSSLLSQTSNSTLIVFEDCTSCGVQNMALSHAAANRTAAAEPRSVERQSEAAQHDSRCAGHARAAAGALLTHKRHLRDRTQSDHTKLTSLSTIRPESGAAVTIRNSFATTLQFLWIDSVFAHVAMSEMANTITILDSQLISAFGPCSVCAAGGIGPPVGIPSANFNQTRVDILQMSRITTNNAGFANASVVWIDIGAGVNTVRLDNVGLINGGTGVRMSSPSDNPAGEYPGRPLFLLANDLEIDFPSGNAIELLTGEEVQISNGYVQGAGSNVVVNRGASDPSLGVGLLIGPRFNSETMVTNTRFFGHRLSGIEIAGGAHATFTNNIIGANSIAGKRVASGVLVKAGVSDFIIQGNHIGDVFDGQDSSNTKFGVEVEPGLSDRYIVSGNTLVGNAEGGLRDGGRGKRKTATGNVD
eukprot:COSAG02_NODE_4048_length_5862_cov_18.270692_7_plen_571_part_00